MFGILGEDDSDVQTLKVIVRRLRNDGSIPIKTKGYDGCAELLRKGARKLNSFQEMGCTHFIVSYDSDGNLPELRYKEVAQRIVEPVGLMDQCCIVIPVEELESWLLADLAAASNIFTGWNPEEIAQPERIGSPKEHLEKLSRDSKRRPRYSHAVHNERLAKYIDLEKVYQKCSSFRALQAFVLNCQIS